MAKLGAKNIKTTDLEKTSGYFGCIKDLGSFSEGDIVHRTKSCTVFRTQKDAQDYLRALLANRDAAPTDAVTKWLLGWSGHGRSGKVASRQSGSVKWYLIQLSQLVEPEASTELLVDACRKLIRQDVKRADARKAALASFNRSYCTHLASAVGQKLTDIYVHNVRRSVIESAIRAIVTSQKYAKKPPKPVRGGGSQCPKK